MKPERTSPKHSREREFTVVLEDIQSQFRVFGEGLGDVRNRLERVEDQLIKLDSIERDVSLIKLAFPSFATQVAGHEARITTLEHSK